MKSVISRIKSRFDLNKPKAATLEEWDEWENRSRTERPFAYFITETVPDYARRTKDAMLWPFRSTRSWIRYNITDRHHVINTGLPPQYHELDDRMLHGMFSLLVDFVEIDQAWMEYCFGDKEETLKVPWYMRRPFKIKSFRRPELGMRYLRWQMSLASPTLSPHDASPHQAHVATEVYVLYHWWKRVRPMRPDPFLLAEQRSARSENPMATSFKDVERMYDEEDDKMLMRLVEIRTSLWT